MNKKQVGAFLKIMSKDTAREVLCRAQIDEYNGDVVLVATDGYQLSAVKIEYGEDIKHLVGKLIRRDALERWYKLASGKSRLNAEEVEAVLSDDYAKEGEYAQERYPEWKKLIPEEGTESPVGVIRFNVKYMNNVQDLHGLDGVEAKFYGEFGPIVLRGKLGTSVVMPLKSIDF